MQIFNRLVRTGVIAATIAFAIFLMHADVAEGAVEPRMTYLDNGEIRVGADLALGGAITWLSKSGSDKNLINSYDWGRQVQMSYYSGPVPFIPDGRQPAPAWRSLGWNPIQVGDAFGNRSSTVESSNDGKEIYVKCIPMQWPLNNVPGECLFESWLNLNGRVVEAHCRLTNARADKTQYEARTQEMPAVYTNAPFHRIKTYSGEHPYRNEPVTELAPQQPPNWSQWFATEGWSALVDDNDWGLGVYSPDCVRFGGGFAGEPGPLDPKSASCGYLAPDRNEILDANIVHDYHYALILGTIEEIRDCANREALKANRNALPEWDFARSPTRLGWSYHEAGDDGFPIHGELNVTFQKGDPQLLSPEFCADASNARALVLNAAFRKTESEAQLFWATVSEPGFSEANSIHFPVNGDGMYHQIRIDLAGRKGYSGAVLRLRLDPANESAGSVKLRSVRFVSDAPQQ